MLKYFQILKMAKISHKKVLLVDDEEDLLEMLTHNLEKEKFLVSTATDGEKAIKLAKEELPDIIILDLMLPVIDGLEVCRQLKKEEITSSVPIIMLTAKGTEVDIVTGLELGADDYITKPFRMRELIARIRAVLRRSEEKKRKEVIKVGDLIINTLSYRVTIKGKPISLTTHEFQVLRTLSENRGRVMTRYQIMESAWLGNEMAPDRIVIDRNIDVHILSLRRKLGKAGRYLQTIRGVGYSFQEE